MTDPTISASELVMAREVNADIARQDGAFRHAADIEAGRHDGSISMGVALAAIRATTERAAVLADHFGQNAYSEGLSEDVVMARSYMASDIVSALSAGQHLESTI